VSKHLPTQTELQNSGIVTTLNICIIFCLQDASGPIGISPGQEKLLKPTQIMKEYFVIKVASGSDHLVCLTNEGLIYTLGECRFVMHQPSYQTNKRA